jgi:hypothetical protein
MASISEVFIPADLRLSSINAVNTEEWAFLTEVSRNDNNCPLQDKATEHTLVAVSICNRVGICIKG